MKQNKNNKENNKKIRAMKKKRLNLSFNSSEDIVFNNRTEGDYLQDNFLFNNYRAVRRGKKL